MNRMKREYCSKGRHPNWKAWTARYGVTGRFVDMNNRYPVTNGFLGAFCDGCGENVRPGGNNVAWGHIAGKRVTFSLWARSIAKETT